MNKRWRVRFWPVEVPVVLCLCSSTKPAQVTPLLPTLSPGWCIFLHLRIEAWHVYQHRAVWERISNPRTKKIKNRAFTFFHLPPISNRIQPLILLDPLLKLWELGHCSRSRFMKMTQLKAVKTETAVCLKGGSEATVWESEGGHLDLPLIRSTKYGWSQILKRFKTENIDKSSEIVYN